MRDLRPMFFRKTILALGLAICAGAPVCVFAQSGGFQDFLGLKGKRGTAQSPAEFSASLVPDGQPGEVALRISAKLPPDHYIYSTTPGQGAETKFTIGRADGLTAIDDDFSADHPPKTEDDKYLGMLEKYYNKVTWSRRYRLESGVDPENVSIAGIVKYQICDKQSCRPNLKYEFDLKLSGAVASASKPARSATQPVAIDASAGDRVSTRFEHLYGKKGSQTVEGVWTVWLEPRQARPGDEVTMTVRAELNPKWHVYPLDLAKSPDGGSLPTAIGLTQLSGLKPLGSSFSGPVPIEVASAGEEGKVERYHEGRIEWSRRFKVADDASEGIIPVSGKVAWQMCNSKGLCLLATGFQFEGKLVVAKDEVPDPVALDITAKLDLAQAGETIDEFRLNGSQVPNGVGTSSPAIAGGPVTVAVETGRHPGIKAQGLPLFLVAAVVAGFAALLTPCVFPMIPITVSFFQKQSEKKHHRPVTMALVYCLGIIGTFTGLGMLMSIAFGAGSLNQLSNSVALNLFIGGILIFFALNLLGLFEIRIPSWLLTYTAGKEGQGGFVGVLFMALTFTLTSFTCTFAFAGLLLAEATKGDRLWPILGLMAFSAAFSLPFFFLALFPSMLQKLPKSGGWMNVVKVIMALVELGAAFKYFGTADQTWNGEAAIFDFHLMISAWAVISIAAALYLLGLFRLPHDVPSDQIGVIRFVAAMSFMGLASYLAVGLFSAEKPHGLVWKYVDSYANPTFESGSDRMGPSIRHGGLEYALDFEKAFDVAVAENKPVFLDFTGVNCVNCRFMEKGPMVQPEIKDRLSRFVRVQLFTDSVPKITDPAERERLRAANVKLQEDWFGDVSLPSYVVIPPDRSVLTDSTRILAALAGKSDDSVFAQFLDHGWKGWQQVQASRSARQVGKR